MSSGELKRGRSFYIERLNPYAKKYINTCAICGKQGYSPTIEDEGFKKGKNGWESLERNAIYSELTKIYSPLQIDCFGRCNDCARRMDK